MRATIDGANDPLHGEAIAEASLGFPARCHRVPALGHQFLDEEIEMKSKFLFAVDGIGCPARRETEKPPESGHDGHAHALAAVMIFDTAATYRTQLVSSRRSWSRPSRVIW